MDASEELRTAANSYRTAAASPRDAALADLLEEAARKAAVREAGWDLAGYSPQEQTQLAESWWRNELAVARALRPTQNDRRAPSGDRGRQSAQVGTVDSVAL